MLAINESVVHTSQMNIYLQRSHHSGLLIRTLIEVVNRALREFWRSPNYLRPLIFIWRGYPLRHFSYGVKHFYGPLKPRVSGRPDQIGARVFTGSWNFGRFYLRGLSSCACGCTDAYYKFIAVGHRNFIERESQVHSLILGARRGTNRSLLLFSFYTRLQPFILHISCLHSSLSASHQFGHLLK